MTDNIMNNRNRATDVDSNQVLVTMNPLQSHLYQINAECNGYYCAN